MRTNGTQDFSDWFWGEVVQRPSGDIGEILSICTFSLALSIFLLLFFFFFFFVLVLFFSSMVSPVSGTHSIDQASLEFTEICLPLPGIKGMKNHTRLVFLKIFQTVKGL